VCFPACFNHDVVVTHLVEQGMADKAVTPGQKNSLALLFHFDDLVLLFCGEKVGIKIFSLALKLRTLRGLGFSLFWLDSKFLRENTHFINYLNGNFCNG
jgi:hypothetical protein